VASSNLPYALDVNLSIYFNKIKKMFPTTSCNYVAQIQEPGVPG
jgi:hypothetical protein